MERRRPQDDGAGGPARGRRRLGRSVLAGLSLFGVLVIWSMATARYGGPDEPAHVLRAASIASGDLLGSPAPGLDPGYRSVEVPAALTTGDPSCFRHDDHTPAACGVADPTAAGSARAASSAGTYPPLYYALVGVPVRLLGDTSDVLWYRAVAAFWCASVLTIAAMRSRRFGTLLVVACLPPATWFLFGVVNPNALEIALATVAWVGVERIRTLRGIPTRADVAWVAAPISLAILIRPVAAIAWVAMLGVLAIGFRHRQSSRWPATQRRLMFGLPIVAVLASVVWNVVAGVDVSDSRTAERLPVLRSLWRAVEGSTETWREMAGSLGWLEFSAPWIAHIVWWSVSGLAAFLVVGGDRSLRRQWLWVLTVFVAGPIVFEVVLARSVGYIWQGRYSIATGVGLVVVGLDAWRTRMSPRVISSIVGLAAFAQVATLWVVLQRYTVGVQGSWWFHGSAWNPPLPPLVLLGADVALLIAAFGLDGASGAGGQSRPSRTASPDPAAQFSAAGRDG